MKTWLDQVVSFIIEKQTSLEQTTFVLPNKRAKIFLRNAFKKKEKALILPELLSVDEYIRRQTKLENIDQLSLLFEFYQITQQTKGQHENFESFVKWAPSILKDFSDIDASLVNPDALFTYLSKAKKIEEWAEGKEPTKMIEHYRVFWDNLYEWYMKLTEVLLKKNLSYDSLNARIAYQNLSKYTFYNKAYFVGFNAITIVHQKIIDWLIKENKGVFLWTAENLYFSKYHQAGSFAKAHEKTYKVKDFCHKTNFINNNRAIFSYGSAGVHGQVTLIRHLFENHKTSQDETVAIVLSDGSLLEPLLHGLSSVVPKTNITMGYSIKNERYTRFFIQWILLLEQEKNYTSIHYQKLYLEFLENPITLYILTYIMGEQKSRIWVMEQQKNFINPLYSKDSILQEPDLKVLFEPLNEHVTDFFHRIERVFSILMTNVNNSTIDKEVIIHILDSIRSCQNYTKIYSWITIRHLLVLFKKLIGKENIHFFGDPIDGVQVMGILETQLLHFDTIFVLSANEGHLPVDKKEKSFIPYDIRTNFGMPTYQDTDSIIAYHFYQLVCRSRVAHIIYNTKNNGLDTAEKSRFLQQMMVDTKHFCVQEKYIQPKAMINKIQEKELGKSPEILSEIRKLFIRGLSPSTINMYCRNPKKFYYKKLLGLDEPQKKSYDIPMYSFGSIVHKTLEDLYSPYINNRITPAYYTKLIQEAIPLFTEHALKIFPSEIWNRGKNYLMRKTAEQYLFRFLRYEQDFAKNNSVIIKALETKLDYIYIAKKDIRIRLYGEIDRVDEVNGVTRLVDYKTGSGKWKMGIEPKNIDYAFLLSNSDYDKIIQMLFYVYLYMKNTAISSLECGIFSLSKMSQGFQKLRIGKSSILNENSLVCFEELLDAFASELLDSNTIFEKRENVKKW